MNELFLILIVPFVLIILVLWVCKKYNFTLMPQDLRGNTTKEENKYQWFNEKNNPDKL